MIPSQKSKAVTAILPNYNYARHVLRRVKEVLSQTYPVSEIIILDDASTDNSVEVIKKAIIEIKKFDPKINVKVKVNKENSGNVFSQWQQGIKLATSDYIWICELDDSAKKDFLREVMRPFENRNVVISYCNSKSINKNGKPVIKDDFRKFKDVLRRGRGLGGYVVDGIDEIDKNLAVYNSIPNVSSVVFKNQARLVDILNTAKKFKLCGDWYFYIEVCKLGKIAYSSRVLNLHRIHKRSVTSSTDYQKRFEETKAIHRYVNKSLNLSNKTKERIVKIEKMLTKNWEIDEE